jgi:hypothetical protein
MEKKKYKYGTVEVYVDASMPVADVKAKLAIIYPVLAHASVSEHDGIVEFIEQDANKGA